jgi:hypothetical protein
MPGQLYLPPEVVRAISAHVERAVKHAEAGYRSTQEEEDAITGDLGSALRTSEPQLVQVEGGNQPGTWRWEISYSKLRSKAKHSTESIVGADGVIELRIGTVEVDQQKSALFQAKNLRAIDMVHVRRNDPNLADQCAKMSNWREAAFVIRYSPSGYAAYSIDDCLAAGGSVSDAAQGMPLARWIIDMFIACRVGHPELYYDKDLRRLYWVAHDGQNKYPERWVWVDFKPKYLVHIDVRPPSWRRSGATKIKATQIAKNRLWYTPHDLFGMSAPFTREQLKKRLKQLRKAYHTDKNQSLDPTLKAMLNARFTEAKDAFEALCAEAVADKPPEVRTAKTAKRRNEGLEEPKPTGLESLHRGARKAERAYTRRKGRAPGK